MAERVLDGVAPLLKWPGGKRALLNEIVPLLPHSFGSYFEPFFGGGALFFRTRPSAATLSDTNVDLIECYTSVRDSPESVIAALAALNNSETDYYEIRAIIPDTPVERAARLIYLASLAFNGIYRVNLQGAFNVPYGHKIHLPTVNPARIRTVSEALAGASLSHVDFEETVATAGRGDLVYLDPPYTVAHGTNGFVRYNARIFSWSDQRRLARVANELVDRGCHVLISNADHSSIHELYGAPRFSSRTIKRHSRISGSSAGRKPVTECLFYSKGLGRVE